MATSESLFTLAEVEEDILKYHRLLASSPRSDHYRPTRLQRLAVRLNRRYRFSGQKGDLDKSITYLTEAVLLPFQPSQTVVHLFFQLANVLLERFNESKRPEDVKSSLKYLRFLRINFHSLETFGIPHGNLTSRLVQGLVLSMAVGSSSGDMIQEMEEMMALFPEFLASDRSTDKIVAVIETFSYAIIDSETGLFRHNDTQRLLDRVIQVLREGTVLKPDLDCVSSLLARCLAVRLGTTRTPDLNDYEEAIAIADNIVASYSPGDNITTRRTNLNTISLLLLFRLDSYAKPEYLEDTIHRLHTLLSLPSLPDQDRTSLAARLDFCAKLRFRYFGVGSNSGETPHLLRVLDLPDPAFAQWTSKDGQMQENLQKTAYRLWAIKDTIVNDEETDVEAAVELSRTLFPSQQPIDRWSESYMPTWAFAEILLGAHQRTNRLDYLNEAITLYRDLRGIKPMPFGVGLCLHGALLKRFILLDSRQDLEECMHLCADLANDGSMEAFSRLETSYHWACFARVFTHPSVSTAYETAMSLMRETLVFSPTLQTQHFRLTHCNVLTEVGALPSDYASYQIERGQFNQAIETLERGRALLWSEMRGLRTSTDQLCAADPASADKFVDINQRLESVTMSVAQSEIGGNSETGAGLSKGMDSFGQIVTTQRRLLEERNTLISHIQSFPGFENFLKPPLFDVLSSAAARGPVIIINQSEYGSHIIILKDSSLSVIFLLSNFHDHANQLKDDLLKVQKKNGLDSVDYQLTLASVLRSLYELIGKLVIERLRQLKVPEKSRVWWCPTRAFCSLPLHAMGPIPSDNGKELYFLDFYITSYTPTLSALIESRKPGSLSGTIGNSKPSLLLVAQPDTLPGAWGEIGVIQTTKTPVTTLVSAMATPKSVVESLRDHRFAHFVCHGLLETGRPFDASLELHGDNLTLLEIVRSHLPAAEFAFLSACHTAELTEDSVADEGLHLTAAMQYCGFRSVVGTMWAMADTDGADLSQHFYKSIFSDDADLNGVPYHERSAKALQLAVKKLRRKRGISLERWVNFVHYGA